MWFRNLQIYRLGRPFELTPETLDERLRLRAFQGCGRMDRTSAGWVPPLGRHGRQLVHALQGYLLVCARKAEKIIPPGVVKQLLDDKVAEIETAESRDIRRRERLRMKEDIIVDLLPRALTRNSDLYAYIDVRNGLIVVDSASAGKAEDLLSLLRDTLGSFPATPVKVRDSITSRMTRWVAGEHLPRDFTLGESCELKHPDPDGGVISCRHQDLAAGEIRNHVKNGKYAVKLALQWRQRLSWVLHEDLSVKGLHFEDIIRETEDDTAAEDPASRFDLDFSLMTLELGEFIPQLFAALGGEELSEPDDRRSAA
jgi:recombination associated protein RdgC